MRITAIVTLKTLLFAAIISLSAFAASAQTQKGADIKGLAASDRLGYSISMPDANTIAIGAPYSNGNGKGPNTGNVSIFTWNGSIWLQKGVNIVGEAQWDESGHSVSMPDANTVAIGAPKNDGNGVYSGHVRIYTWDGTKWIRKGLDIDSENPSDNAGWSLSMPDANTIAIGAISNDGNGTDAGHTRVYIWNGSNWLQKGADIDGETYWARSGYSVCMPDANTIGIGAPGNGDGANNPGRTNVYKWDGTSWIKKGKGIDGEGDGDRSGHSVSMPDENTIAIGAPSNINGADAGHVRVYSWNNSVWTQKGTDIDGEAAGDGSGWSVSMPDSNTVAIGAWENQANGINSGHVRIFGWNGNKWIQRGPDINGKPSDFFGWSICMPDVNTISIGGAQNPGLVRVYTLNNLNFSQNTFGNALKSFPNPTHGEMNIELGANYNDVSVIVRNATGQEVSRKSFNNANSLQFNIPGEPGFYTMEVAAQDKKALLKVMKK